MLPPPPRFTLFPYTTLFRSSEHRRGERPPTADETLEGEVADVERVRAPVEHLLDDELRRRGSMHEPVTRKTRDRKSTRLNSSHSSISYAVFCLKKKKINQKR